MAVGCWVTGAIFFIVRAFSYVHLVVLIATLVLAFTMAHRIEKMRVGTAIAMFVTFSALFGVTLSIYLLVYEVSSLVLCFGATALYFGALAAYG